jgi:hypothetical protein
MMPMTGQQTNVGRWFDGFRTMKNACAAINGLAGPMNLSTFGGTTIAGMLPSDNEKGQFSLSCKHSLDIDVATGDFTAFPTFKQLWDHFSLLKAKVEDFLQTLAAGNFPSGSAAAFDAAPVSAAFPGGSLGAQWTTANTALARIFPPDCYSAAQQVKVGGIVNDATKKISDLVQQIATLG